MKMLNFGSVNLDYVYHLNHFVQPGETILSHQRETNCGGKGLNQSIALAKTGLLVYHAGISGYDGALLREYLQQNHVDITFLKEIPELSGHTIIQVTPQGENCIILYPGANAKVDHSHIDFVLSHFEKGDICLIQNEISCIDYLIEQASKKELTIVFNPSPYTPELSTYPLNKVSYLILNEIEGEQITGQSSSAQILSTLQQQYPQLKIILTLGESGAIYQDSCQQIKQPIFSTNTVDTTAAGDTFTGYFIYSIQKGLSPKDGLILASAAAAIAVSRSGAACSIPSLKEVNCFLENQKTC